MKVLRRWQLDLPVGDRIALVAAVVLVFIQALATSEPASADTRSFDAGAVALLVAGFALVAGSRRAPVTAALGNLVLIVFWYMVGYTSGVINLPYTIAFYLLGATGDRRRQLIGGGIAVLACAYAILDADEPVASAAGAIGWTVAAILFGELTHSRRALLAEYKARALRAEAERDAEAERQVANVRLEIARDLHDVLAHTVSVMTVQAGVGKDALARGADGASAALDTIRAAGRDAMEEIQALVAVLRDGADPGGTAPAPRVDRLGDLVAAMSSAGLEVSLVVDVPTGAASDVAELTAYRVVQESLTNVVRHASAQTARVTVRVEDTDLVVDVRDDGAGASLEEAVAGFGLRGMHERVEALGGHLRAGPEPAGGWRVTARIPCDRRRRLSDQHLK